MFDKEYLKKLVGALIGAAVAVPSIATGFYMAYQLVTTLGN